jgi:hypothetical protein
MAQILKALVPLDLRLETRTQLLLIPDSQECIRGYAPDCLSFHKEALVLPLRQGAWVAGYELNLEPSDVVEASAQVDPTGLVEPLGAQQLDSTSEKSGRVVDEPSIAN